MNKQELLESKHFCILPFVHACVWTDGRVIPCCINQDQVLGNARTQPLNEIFSNSNIVLSEIRKEMLTGPELPKSCYRCAQPEEQYGANSYRYFSNKHYGHLIDNLEFDENNNLVENKISLWDVRFSNLCNLKCRTCDSVNSSKIAEEERTKLGKTIPVLQQAFDDNASFFEFFKKNIDHIEEIYFCGGEPLLLEEHYQILDLLVENKKFDTVLRYNTNCTKLSFKGKNVVDDYWPLFKIIRLSASLDAGWEQLSYIRHGTNWETILNNLKAVKEKCPHVFIQLCPTIGILNAFCIKRLHVFLAKEQIINVNDVYFNILNYPNYYSLTALPKSKKQEVEQHWLEYANEVQALGATFWLIDEIKKVIKFMYSKDESSELVKLREETRSKDLLRDESHTRIFPELTDIL